jgi:phage replication-related protein YjqB (UPF0714/DUF867 family)
MRKPDKYGNFLELKRGERANSWRVRRRLRCSPVLIIAPHGGRIEPGTSEIAALIAGESYNLYRFEGRKPPGQNAVLHITSHHFDEPRALKLAKKCCIVLGIHGCGGRYTIYVGGRDTQLREALAVALLPTGLRVEAYRHKYRAMEPLNICNRGSRLSGAQLEITRDLRRSQQWRERIAAIARDVIERYLVMREPY